MATPETTYRFLTKAKLAGLLRQLLSYGVKLPDLSPLSSISNSTAAVILDVRKKKATVEGNAQFSVELFGVRAINQPEVKMNHKISHHDEFVFHCYCKPHTAERGPAYQFWLSALGQNVSINGKSIMMTDVLLNIMANSVSLIQTSCKNKEFHLFVQLHEIYWPPVDRDIKWEQHFYPAVRDKTPTFHVPDECKRIEEINEWMEDMENHLRDTDEHPYNEDKGNEIEGLENQSATITLARTRRSTKVPLAAEKNVLDSGRSSSHLPNPGKSSVSHAMGISRGSKKLDGAKPLLGHRRSSRLKESILLNRQG